MPQLNIISIIKKGKKYRLMPLLCCFVLVCYARADAAPKPVAKVNNAILTESHLEEALNEIMPAAVFHGGFSSKKRASYRPQAMDKMIEKELLYQEAVRMGMKADKSWVEEVREKTITRLGGKKQFKAALKRDGITEKQYRKRIEKQNLIQKIVDTEIKDKAKASDKDIALYYKENKKRFIRPKALKLRHILISVKPSATAEEKKLRKDRAQEVVDKIRAGEDMASLAWNYSDDRYRIKGGDYGFVHAGRLDPDLEKALMKLEVGKLSGIIETRFGYHIARIESILPETQLNLEEASPKIRKILEENKEKQLRDTLVTKLKKEALIEVY